MTLAELENDIWEKGSLNREHIHEWLRLQTNSDSEYLKSGLRDWLVKLEKDPRLSKVIFPPEPSTASLNVPGSPVDRIVNDLDSYGRVLPETLIGAEPNILDDENVGLGQ